MPRVIDCCEIASFTAIVRAHLNTIGTTTITTGTTTRGATTG